MTAPPKKSLFQSVIAVGLICIALVTGIYLTQGRMPAEKIATALAMPTGALWLMMLIIAAHMIRNRQRAAAFWMLMTVCCYSAVGSGFVAGELVYSLESPYHDINPLQSERHFDAVVLLGGGGSTGANGRLQANASGDRMILAAQLYHSGITDEVICTGQRIKELSPNATDPAIISQDVLLALGVPETAISQLGGRNTTEEMRALQERFGEDDSNIGLVTSAWHMPRAMGLANRVGFHPAPLPADFRSHRRGNDGPTVGGFVENVIPGPGAMLTTWACCKEYLGMLIGR